MTRFMSAGSAVHVWRFPNPRAFRLQKRRARLFPGESARARQATRGDSPCDRDPPTGPPWRRAFRPRSSVLLARLSAWVESSLNQVLRPAHRLNQNRKRCPGKPINKTDIGKVESRNLKPNADMLRF